MQIVRFRDLQFAVTVPKWHVKGVLLATDFNSCTEVAKLNVTQIIQQHVCRSEVSVGKSNPCDEVHSN